MIPAVFLAFVNLFVPVFSVILVLRVLMSYIAKPGNRFMEWLTNLTEPLLGPVRKILPLTAGIDFAPLVVLLLLQGLQTVLNTNIPH